MSIKYNEAYLPLLEGAYYKYFVLSGGRGAGRSHAVAIAVLLECLKKPTRVLCAREHMNKLDASVHLLLQDKIRELQVQDHFIVQHNRILGKNGSLITYTGLEGKSQEDLKAYENFSVCWIEEAANVSKSSWQALIPSIRDQNPKFFITFNSRYSADSTYKRFVLDTPPNTLKIFTTYRDNSFVPKTLLDEKDYLFKTDPETAAHVWDGKLLQNSNAQVLGGKWRVESFVPDREWEGPYFGVDWGFSQDPTTMIKCYLDKKGTLYIHEEVYARGIDLDKLPNYFDKITDSRRYTVRADCSRPETISHMKNKGFRMIAADSWKNSVEDGVAWLRARNGIVIHPNCRKTAEEALLWSYKIDKNTEDPLPDLKSGNDHCWDAVRYAMSPMIKNKLALNINLEMLNDLS